KLAQTPSSCQTSQSAKAHRFLQQLQQPELIPFTSLRPTPARKPSRVSPPHQRATSTPSPATASPAPNVNHPPTACPQWWITSRNLMAHPFSWASASHPLSTWQTRLQRVLPVRSRVPRSPRSLLPTAKVSTRTRPPFEIWTV